MEDEQAQQAADMLRRLLDAVERGGLTAESARGRQLLLRIEGAVVGLEAGAGGRRAFAWSDLGGSADR